MEEETTRRGPGRRWWLHLLGLVLVLVAVAATSDLDASWNSDDGAYAVQAELVREHGRWDHPNRHPEADPDGSASPIAHAVRTEEGRAFPYVKLPLWIVVLVGSTEVLGPVVGLHVPALAGVALAGLAAWALAVALDRRDLAPWAFWAVGLGPLLVESTALWAHSVAAAAAGVVAVLVARRAAGSATVRTDVAAAAAALVLVLLRNEGALLLAAAAAVLAALGGFRSGSVWARGAAAVRWAAPVAAGGAAGLVANRVWSGRILGAPTVASLDDPPALPWAEGRVQGALRTFVDGAGSSTSGTVLALLGIGAGVLAGLALRRGDRMPAVALGAVLAALHLARAVDVGRIDLAGTLVAAPLLTVGLVAWRPSRAPAAERALAAVVGLTWLLVLATQYQVGGGPEWGGRYALVAAVPAVVLALAALHRAWVEADGPTGERARPVLLAAAAVLVAVPTVAGLWATRDGARRTAAEIDAVAALDDGGPVVFTARFVPRLGWRELPEADWLVGRPDEVDALVAGLAADTGDTVLVLGPGAEEVLVPEGYRAEPLDLAGVRLVPDP